MKEPRPRDFLDLGILLGVLALLGAVVAPRWIRARARSNESEAIASLKKIVTAEQIFHECDKEQDGNLDYGMLSELSNAGLVDAVLGSGTRSGYVFQACYSPSCSEFLWFGTADPEEPRVSGRRYFATGNCGVIFFTTDEPFPIAEAFEKDTHCTSNGYFPGWGDWEERRRRAPAVVER
jgi:hypothetical protein